MYFFFKLKIDLCLRDLIIWQYAVLFLAIIQWKSFYLPHSPLVEEAILRIKMYAIKQQATIINPI